MKHRIWIALALVAVAAAPADQSSAITQLLGGRTITLDDGSYAFGWPGTYFEGRFTGKGVRVRFTAESDHLRILIDGVERAMFRSTGPADASFTGLADGPHVIRLEKMTETQQGGSIFAGFTAIGGRALPPLPRARQIGFIGDSYTVGYGNTSSTRECTRTEVHDTTDTQQAFGPIVARRYDADYRLFAYSGFGIVRNYAGGNPELSLPKIFARPRPDAVGEAVSPDPAWHPQLIVINLGTNDFSTKVQPGERWPDSAALEADYRATYANFVRSVRKRQPQARFLLMGSDLFYPQVEQVAAMLKAEGAPVDTLQFTGLDLGGCNWHPSLTDHRKIADLLASKIESLFPGWAPAA